MILVCCSSFYIIILSSSSTSSVFYLSLFDVSFCVEPKKECLIYKLLCIIIWRWITPFGLFFQLCNGCMTLFTIFPIFHERKLLTIQIAVWHGLQKHGFVTIVILVFAFLLCSLANHRLNEIRYF